MGTTVLVTPAPDLSAVPGVPAALRALLQGACRHLQQQQAAAAVAAGGLVAPVTAELARAFADPALYSADRYHPSSRGYARIASALEPHVLTAARSRIGAADEAG